jgi:hypothetical protein
VYWQLHAAMSQAPVKENIPYSWARLACVKAHHYQALAHYFTATLLMDHQRKAWGLGSPGWGQGSGLAAGGSELSGGSPPPRDAHSLMAGVGKDGHLDMTHTPGD